MIKKLTMIFAGLFLCAGMALAQMQVNGTVSNADDGEPVIGASVKVVGSKQGAVTNVDGYFSLSAPAGAMLEISYIGMETKTVKAAQNMRILLSSDTQQLEEFVSEDMMRQFDEDPMTALYIIHDNEQ